METSFKEALANLLDNTETYSRSEWAKYLLVSEPAISQWTNGKTMPKAELLKSILLHLENYDEPKVLQHIYAFHEMADLPVEKTLNIDLQIRYARYETITNYISSAYQNVLNTEVAGIRGSYRKQYFYLCTSLSRMIKEVAEDFSDVDQTFVLARALGSITRKDIEKLLTEKLIQQKVPTVNREEAVQHVERAADSSIGPKQNSLMGCMFHGFIDSMHTAKRYFSPWRAMEKPPLIHSLITWNMPFDGSFVASKGAFQHFMTRNGPIEISIDEQLYLQRLSVGDTEAFKRIVELYYSDVKTQVAIQGWEQDLEDIVQDVFLLVWTNRRQLAQTEEFREFLFRTVEMYEQFNQLKRLKISFGFINASDSFRDRDVLEGLEIIKKMELCKF